MTKFTLFQQQRLEKRWGLSNLFCIVSAIGNDYGIFSYQQRFKQLLESIDSIRKYAPNSDIVIYDASEDPLPIEDVEHLKTLVNQVAIIHDDKYVQFLKFNSKDPDPNKSEKKTVGEIQATIAFLEFLKSHPIKYNRVFKLTGRYKLNDNFKLSDYQDKQNKCVFLEKEDWYGEWVFRIRLWSFDYEDLDTIKHLFHTMQKHTYQLVTDSKKLEVVEFTFTEFIESMKIPYATVAKIGVCGLSGHNASVIDE